jgi:hypothetical protein
MCCEVSLNQSSVAWRIFTKKKKKKKKLEDPYADRADNTVQF